MKILWALKEWETIAKSKKRKSYKEGWQRAVVISVYIKEATENYELGK